MQKIALEMVLLNWANKNPETLARAAEKLKTSWKPKARQLSLIDHGQRTLFGQNQLSA
jgi:hypothetical protein